MMRSTMVEGCGDNRFAIRCVVKRSGRLLSCNSRPAGAQNLSVERTQTVTTLESTRPTDKPLPQHFDSNSVVGPARAAEMMGISKATLERLWKAGKGPERFWISPRRVGIKLRSIGAYLDGCGGSAA